MSSTKNEKLEKLPVSTPDSEQNNTMEPVKKKRKKVVIACVYCRRSHMICDDKRPCSRCIKRNIGHLCHDEPVSQKQKKKLESKVAPSEATVDSTPNTSIIQDASILTPSLGNLEVQSIPQHLQAQLSFDDKTTSGSVPDNAISSAVKASAGPTSAQPTMTSSKSLYSMDPLFNFNQQPFFFSEHAGSEFSSLNEFLSMLDDPELMGNDKTHNNNNTNNNSNGGIVPNSSSLFEHNTNSNTNLNNNNNSNQQHQQQPQSNPLTASHSLTNLSLTNLSAFNSPNLSSSNLRFNLGSQLLPHIASQQTSQQPHHLISDSARDKFFLTAADPSTEISPEERLKQVINAKLEAGLLQPYNYAKGYARLQAYMDNYMNQSSKQRILKPLSIFRPAFRAIARTLKDVDLILVEENFERMLLDYDRVFTSMAIPACLWRRTGEIYRGNKEFASLVEVSADDLRDGKLAIYELMSEESAVNFWEKYGAIAFDKGQKAVLTSCNLRTKDGRRRKTCCFSFTIRRDRYNIPSCIVGNFIPINP